MRKDSKMPKNKACYFVSDEHKYGRLEDALSDAARRAYETQKHTTVLIYAPSREAALNFGGNSAAEQFDAGGPDNPIGSVNVKASFSLWG